MEGTLLGTETIWRMQTWVLWGDIESRRIRDRSPSWFQQRCYSSWPEHGSFKKNPHGKMNKHHCQSPEIVYILINIFFTWCEFIFLCDEYTRYKIRIADIYIRLKCNYILEVNYQIKSTILYQTLVMFEHISKAFHISINNNLFLYLNFQYSSIICIMTKNL